MPNRPSARRLPSIPRSQPFPRLNPREPFPLRPKAPLPMRASTLRLKRFASNAAPQQRSPMQKPLTLPLPAVFIAVLIISPTMYLWLDHHRRLEKDLHARLFVVQKELSLTREDLIGYTKFTDYLTESKVALTVSAPIEF